MTAHEPTEETRETLKRVALEAARTAGGVLVDKARSGFRVEHKQTTDLVTDADRASEQAIIDTIRASFPEHGVLAEERGLTEPCRSEYRWVVDPLDGTTNFAHGLPIYCVSIAVEHRGRIILGVIWDPVRGELFVAETGRGATLNGRPIHVSPVTKLGEALLVTGFAYDIRDTPQNNLNYFGRFSLSAQGVRRLGAAALDLCYVAAGRLDGFWELKLHPWDMAAGALLVTEAGGRMSGFSGRPFSIYGEELVASNGLIHDQMLDVLQRRDESRPST